MCNVYLKAVSYTAHEHPGSALPRGIRVAYKCSHSCILRDLETVADYLQVEQFCKLALNTMHCAETETKCVYSRLHFDENHRLNLYVWFGQIRGLTGFAVI